MTVYLETVHGSHLYGLATPTSDYDTFRVVDEKRGKRLRHAKQKVTRDDAGNAITDVTEVGLTTFLVQCDKAVPQYLEALFSPVAVCDPLMEFYRRNYRLAPANAYQVYRRTAYDFAEQGTFKFKRHALRLLVNLRDGLAHGQFNPRLDARTAALVTNVAEWPDEPYQMFMWYFDRQLEGMVGSG